MISEGQLKKLVELITQGKGDWFYSWAEWLRLREEVLRYDHYECQICKKRGKYSKAIIVHHVKHLRDRPDLALSIWDGEERQLVSVCKSCHEECHPERIKQWQYKARQKQVTDERWD